jgi:iron complex outermembrane receptor protein/hemoglobin/transferrin/lactoferrin receptor protein
VRGLTGEQTVVVFDGVRLNTSTWRAGPNQYLFTLDAASLDSLAVLRGGGSTWFGADALGGVIVATPLEAPDGRQGASFRPTVTVKGASADDELGGRAQVEAAVGALGFIGGVGARRVGLLESAGPVRSPRDGAVPEVPRFLADGRTQQGTGFNELTGDARFTLRLSDAHSLTAALYAYRQFDAPRTDQCPPPGGRADECLTVKEQFRTLAYVAWSLRTPDLSLRVTGSWQRQHEQREAARPASFVLSGGRDVVDSLGLGARLSTRSFSPVGGLGLLATLGVDSTLDLVDSSAWLTFTDLAVTVARSRGQYLAGSRALTGGVFGEGQATFAQRLVLRLGGRLGWAQVDAPGDAESGSLEVSRGWLPFALTGGAQWQALDWLALVLDADRSFRAPNLDDLTSRQQTGPGFQFENPALRPETATTLELGARVRTDWLTVEAWVFQTWLADAVGKQPRAITDCPPATPQCAASWNRFQLVNAPAWSELRGVEALVRARLPWNLQVRATLSVAWGEGPSLVPQPADPAVPWQPRAPLSRVPPTNGVAELSWTHPGGLGATAALRWAALQDRLAVADQADARIPLGGTPGFAVVDLRLHARLSPAVFVAVVVENLLDTPWRAHGSSVNGPGRGVLLSFTFSPPK